MVQLEGVGGAQGDGLQRVGHRDAFMGAQHSAGGSQPVHGAPGGEQRPQRGDGRVAVDGEGHAAALRGGACVHPLGALRPDCGAVVLVAPVEMVVGKQVDAHVQRLHPPELRRIGQLAVLQVEAVVTRGRRLQGRGQAVQRQFGSLIAVGVGVHLYAALQRQGVAIADGFWRGVPKAIRRAIKVARPAHAGRKTLDGAIGHHLDAAQAQPLGAAAAEGHGAFYRLRRCHADQAQQWHQSQRVVVLRGDAQ